MRTGDLGHVDGQGRVVITGRIKELIKVNAGQVPPAELEMLLGTCDGVIECAVVGRPNRYQGEIPVAYLVLGDTANPYLITDAVNEQVLPYKRIRAIEIIDSLPRNATGKVDRRALAVIDSERRRGRSGQSAALP